ncbi:MAG: peptidylprolyl isomerase [Ramlibacter sp.]
MEIRLTFLKTRRDALLRTAALFILGVAAVVCPASPALAQSVLGAGGDVKITDLDMRATAELIPLSARAGLLSRKENIEQQAQGLYLRRALAEEAIRTGIDQTPIVQALITLARERILSDAVLGALDASKVPSDAVLESYAQSAYKADPSRFKAGEQTHARHILIRNTGPEARARAEKLLEQIKGGKSFEALARADSEDSTTSAKGGDLGFFSPDTMVKPFQAGLAELKNPGDVSGIVESDFGYHLIKLESRRPAGVLPYAEVREALRTEARTRALQEARAEKINKLLEQFKADPAAIDAFTQRYK